MSAQYNRRRTRRLLRGFDRAVVPVKGFLIARYGSTLARKLSTEARQEYARFIPDLPDLHGSKLHVKFITSTGWFLAFPSGYGAEGKARTGGRRVCLRSDCTVHHVAPSGRCTSHPMALVFGLNSRRSTVNVGTSCTSTLGGRHSGSTLA